VHAHAFIPLFAGRSLCYHDDLDLDPGPLGLGPGQVLHVSLDASDVRRIAFIHMQDAHDSSHFSPGSIELS
jgi:hypothetical protein